MYVAIFDAGLATDGHGHRPVVTRQHHRDDPEGLECQDGLVSVLSYNVLGRNAANKSVINADKARRQSHLLSAIIIQKPVALVFGIRRLRPHAGANLWVGANIAKDPQICPRFLLAGVGEAVAVAKASFVAGPSDDAPIIAQ